METVHNRIIETITPIKSVNDHNEYRIIRLDNGVKALIISTFDSTTAQGDYSLKEGPHFLRHGATARAKNYASEFFFTNKPRENGEPQSQDVDMEGCRTDQGDEDLGKPLEDIDLVKLGEYSTGQVGDDLVDPLDNIDAATLDEYDADPHPDSIDWTEAEDKDDSDESGDETEINESLADPYPDSIDGTEMEDKDDSDESMWDGYELDEYIDKVTEADDDTIERLLLDESGTYLLPEDHQKNCKEEEIDDFEDNFGSCSKFTNDAVNLGYDTIPYDLADIERSKDEVGKLTLPDSQTKTAKHGSVSITYPVGALTDYSSRIGISDLSRHVIENDSVVSVDSGFETSMTTFTHLCEVDEDVDSCFKGLVDALAIDTDHAEKRISSLLQSKNPYGNSTCEIKNSLDYDTLLLSDKKQLQLLYSLSKEHHPFKAVSPDFCSALSKQLKQTSNYKYEEELKNDLVDVWTYKYCLHLATIVIQSSETLDSLESILLKYVGHAKYEIEEREEYLESPFDMTTFAKFYKVVYTGKENLESSLVLTWALNPSLWKNYKSKPMDYVSWMISHKCEGGLYDTLYEKGWINDVQAGCNHTGYHRNNYVSLFQIKITLTTLGLNEKGAIRMIVKTVFAYLKFLKAYGVQDDIFAALHFSRQTIFNSLELESSTLRNLQVPISHTACPVIKISVLGERMQMIPEENLCDLLTMDTLFFECSRTDVENLLTSLDMDTCNFMLNHPSFKEEFENTEIYYGTKYSRREIPTTWKELEEENQDLVGHFRIPQVSQAIEKSFNSGPLMFDTEDIVPMLVLKNEHVHVWKKSIATFKKVAAYIIHFGSSPLLCNSFPNRAAMIAILSTMLNEDVVQELDVLKLSGLHYSIAPTHIGILVKIFGHQSQSIYAVKVVLDRYNDLISRSQKSENPRIESVLHTLKRTYIRALGCSQTLARCVYNSLSVRNYVPLNLQSIALENLTNDSYSKEFNLFQQSSKTGMLAIGYCSHIQTLELAMNLPENPSSDIAQTLGNIEVFSYMWPVGYNIIRLVNEYMENDTIRISQHYQLGVAIPKSKAFAHILLDLIKRRLVMEQNREDHMLIDARVNEFNSVMDLELIGSASNISADKAEECLNDFMNSVSERIEKSRKSFQCNFSVATSCLAIKRSCGKTHHSVINELHDHERKIKDFSFAFQHIPEENKIYSAERKDFEKWCGTNFNKEMRKLSIQIVPSLIQPTKKSRSKKVTDEKIITSPNVMGYTLVKPGLTHNLSENFINDLEQFKRRLQLYNPTVLNFM